MTRPQFICYTIFQYSEFLDNVLTKGVNIFKNFDLKIEGDFSLPRTSFNYFHREKHFLVGGLVPMHFGKNFSVQSTYW